MPTQLAPSQTTSDDSLMPSGILRETLQISMLMLKKMLIKILSKKTTNRNFKIQMGCYVATKTETECATRTQYRK